MAQITYTDKVALNVNSDIPAINKVNDTDMNEIKTVVNSNETKVLLAVTDTAPAQCSTGDKYYNTTTKLIYTATATNTWDSTGVAPTENTLYIEFSTQSTYAYNGTDLISVGGGTDFSSLIMVDPDVADQQTKLVIESTDIDGSYEVNTETYSTSETLTNKIWIDGKPIYRKVYTSGTYSTGQTTDTLSLETSSTINPIWSGGFIILANFKVSIGTGDLGFGAISNVMKNPSNLIYIERTANSYGTYNGCQIIIEYTKSS